MSGIDVLVRSARALLLTAAILAIAPALASAATAAGGLEQLPSPNDCISSAPTTACGNPVSGGLGAARSVAVTPDGASAYVASTTGSLTTLSRNLSTGELNFEACVKDPTSTEACGTNSNRPLDGAAWVIANNGFVYVAAADADTISVFQRNADTGDLTAVGCTSTSATNSAGGPDCDVSNGLSGVDRLTLSSDGDNVYATSSSNSTLVNLEVQPDGTLLPPGTGGCLRGTGSTDVACNPTPTPGLNGANAVDVSPDDNTVYVTASSGGTGNVSFLTSYTRNGGTGAIAQNQCFHSNGATGGDAALPPCATNPTPTAGLDGADGVTVSPDNTNLYVAAGSAGPTAGNSLVTFNRNGGTGNLTSARCFRDAASSTESCGSGTSGDRVGLKGAFDVALTPDGKFLYVTASTGHDVAEFSRNTGTGDLTQLAGNDKCIGRATSNTDCAPNNTAKGLQAASDIELSPDGLFAYVAAPDDSAVSEFRIEAPPVCSNVGPVSTGSNQPVSFTLPCSDPNPGEPATCVVDTQPTNGTVSQPDMDEPCNVTYTPDTGFSGNDSFTFHATDPAGQSSATRTASLTVAGGTPSVTISDAAANESAGSITFQLTLSSPVGTPVNVNYNTRDSSATAPSDYTAKTNVATFDPNTTTTSVTITVNDDSVHEVTEHFFVDLTATTAGTTIARPNGKGTLGDDDGTAVGVADTTVDEGDGTAKFTLTLSNPSATTVNVDWATANGTATAPGDYTAQPGATVTFSPGQTSKQVSVPIVNDTTPEQTEQFSVSLSDPTGGATLGDATAGGTIQDNDLPQLAVSDAAVSEGNSGTRNAAFTVSLSVPISRTVTVNFATADGTALSASDYNTSTGTLTFAPGETSKTVNVVVNGDTAAEGDETFTLGLSSAANATISDATGDGTILDDDTVNTTPGLFVSDVSLVEGDAGQRAANFTVSLTAASGSEVKVNYATADGTALAASDYNSGTGVLTFAPGETSKTVEVQVNGDTTFEPDETFSLKLSGATGAPISKDTGTGTIVNDDAKPVARAKPRGLQLSVTPRRDRTRPFRYVARGKLLLPSGVTKANGCGSGTVRVQFSSGGKPIAAKKAPVNANCRYRVVTTFVNRSRIVKGKLRVTARFSGNKFLRGISARALSVRAG